jgi:hypothetical protein
MATTTVPGPQARQAFRHSGAALRNPQAVSHLRAVQLWGLREFRRLTAELVLNTLEMGMRSGCGGNHDLAPAGRGGAFQSDKIWLG